MELEELAVTEEVTVNLSKTVMVVHQELADKLVLVEEIMVITQELADKVEPVDKAVLEVLEDTVVTTVKTVVLVLQETLETQVPQEIQVVTETHRVVMAVAVVNQDLAVQAVQAVDQQDTTYKTVIT